MAIILFDGVCNLCNSSINFIIDRDTERRFRFASLQSVEGEALLRQHGLIIKATLDSVILIENEKVYQKSAAALRIARHLGGAWPLLGIFWLVPSFLRDAVYNLIARNRYRWFGRQESCRLPTPELKERFL